MKYLIVLLAGLGLANSVTAQRLDSLETFLLQNNPELLAMQKELEAADQSLEVARNNLPNLQVRAGILAVPPNPGPGMERVSVGVSQMLPAKGVLKNGERVAEAQLSALQEEYKLMKLTKLYQLRTAYYQLYYIQNQIETTQNLQENLKSLQPVALQSYSSGKSPMSQVLRLQSKILELEKGLNMQNSDLAEVQAMLASLLSYEQYSIEASLPGELNLTSNTVALADTIHPIINQWQYRQQARNYGASMAESMRNPMFGVGLQYMYMANGMHGLMPMAMVEIPIWRKKNKAMVDEQKLMAESISYKEENSKNELVAEWNSIQAQLQNTENQLEVLNEQLKLENSLREQLQTEFSAGTSSLENILEEENSLLSLKLEKLKLTVEQLKLQARLKYLRGE